ncbi:hypothetical protein BDZ85DRAFT_93904 [Elsinoe ampelina]|uniref:Uncharacterized protein n=1 Tax=Elsinoe ampelina TaxID=302913 RepID=A0A6A6FYF5_9PEZI|nr:hypothetical protein BDZ85DRAFT_93904 [Elsinoe ampelina]
MPGIDLKRAEPTLQLEVDAMIIDYLVYNATRAILDESADRPSSIQKADKALHQVNDFLKIFNQTHTTTDDLPDLEFRLRVLQLITLFYAGHSPAVRTPPTDELYALRSQNASRVRPWEILERLKGRQGLNQFDPATATTNILRQPRVLLLDILPMFMSLSVLITDTDPLPPWMDLARDFMTQAVLQAVPHAFDRSAVLREAFLWGSPAGVDGDAEEQALYEMLWVGGNVDETEGETWPKLRKHRIQELLAMNCMKDASRQARTRERKLKKRYPADQFEQKAKSFLEGLSRAVAPPALLLVDGGRLPDLSEKDTKLMAQRCGALPWNHNHEDVKENDLWTRSRG